MIDFLGLENNKIASSIQEDCPSKEEYLRLKDDLSKYSKEYSNLARFIIVRVSGIYNEKRLYNQLHLLGHIVRNIIKLTKYQYYGIKTSANIFLEPSGRKDLRQILQNWQSCLSNKSGNIYLSNKVSLVSIYNTFYSLILTLTIVNKIVVKI